METQREKGPSSPLQHTEPKLGPCSHTAPQASPSAPPPTPMPTRIPSLIPSLSPGGLRFPQDRPQEEWPGHSCPAPMELKCFGPAQHLRSISGCVRRQALHPCLRASLQPSALSLLPVAPQPLRKQPGVHWDLRARPASQLRERAQPWPQGTLFRALSFVGTPGLWHSWQETLCGECFNKSPFENGIFFSQRARALLRQPGHPPQQPNPPPRWGSEKHLLSTEHPIFFDRIYRFLRWHQWQKTCRPVQETNTSSIRGLGRCPGGGHGNPLQCSCLENPHGQRSLVGYSP